MKPSQAIQVLVKAFELGQNVLIWGAPGVGKTDIAHQAAATVKRRMEIFHPVVSDPTDFKGFPWVQDGNAEFLPFGGLRRLVQAKVPTVAFLDDLGQAAPAVQAAAMQLLLARRINGHIIPDCVSFVAATNRREDKAGVQGILEPVKSRFPISFELEADLNDWCVWAYEHNLPPELIGFYRFRPDLLHKFVPTKGRQNSPSPRTAAHVGAILNSGYPEELLFELIAGAAGEGLSVEFTAFRKIFLTLQSPDEILLTPERFVPPKEVSARYAITAALSSRATENNFERVCKVAAIYDKQGMGEFSVLLITDCVRRMPKLTNTKGYIQWCIAHRDIV